MRLHAAEARLDDLATQYPATPRDYGDGQRRADDALMHAAWARSLCTVADARPPRRDQPLRVVTQASVSSDGVSEAGLAAEAVFALFSHFADVERVTVPDLAAIDNNTLRGANDRQVLLAGNHRTRYVHPGLKPDLHLPLWNPYQVADVAAPAVVPWGHADGALAAAKAWLEGRAGAPGHSPVPLGPHP